MNPDGIFRTQKPAELDDGEEQKIVIYVPRPEADSVDVGTGTIQFTNEPQSAVSVIDPRGCEWDVHESIEQLLMVIREFLASDDDWLQLVTPKEGEPVLLHRSLVERVCLIQNATATIRKDHLRPPKSKLLRVVRGLPGESLAHARRPG